MKVNQISESLIRNMQIGKQLMHMTVIYYGYSLKFYNNFILDKKVTRWSKFKFLSFVIYRKLLLDLDFKTSVAKFNS